MFTEQGWLCIENVRPANISMIRSKIRRKSEWAKAYMKERRADPVIGEVLRKRDLKRKHDIYYNSPFSRKNITQERVQNEFYILSLKQALLLIMVLLCTLFILIWDIMSCI